MSTQQSLEQGIDDTDRNDEMSTESEELAVELEYLREENRRLREQYAHARRTNYRRTALGLAVLGVIAVGGGVVLPSAQSVLFSLGAIGLFSGLLTYYLTPERFIAADVGERVYSTLAGNEAQLVEELGLGQTHVYVPADDFDDARLFLPQREQYELPDMDALENVFVVPDNPQQRGVSFVPTGQGLYEEFEQSRSGTAPESPAESLTQLTDALVELFEIVDSTAVDLDAADGRASITITNGVYGGADQFDNPAASFLAVGLATELGTPVSLTVSAGNSDQEFTVTCRWEVDEET